MRRCQNDDNVAAADNDGHNDVNVDVAVYVTVAVAVAVALVVEGGQHTYIYCNQEFMLSTHSLSLAEVSLKLSGREV